MMHRRVRPAGTYTYREGDREYLFDATTDTYRAFDLRQDRAEHTNLANELTPEQKSGVYQQLAAWVQYQERLVTKVGGRAGK